MRSAMITGIVFLTLAVLCGVLKSLAFSLQHFVHTEPWWLAGYLIAVLVEHLAPLAPGFVIGYACGHRHLVLVFLLGILAYYLQYTVGSYVYYAINPPQVVDGVLRLPDELQWQTVLAYGLGLSAVSAMSVFAGAFLKNVRSTSNHSLKADVPDGPRP